jgi:hypothetical protein
MRTNRTAGYSLTVNQPTACPAVLGAQAPVLGNLVVNEVLYDPAVTGGDANNDGVRDARDDEFVEIVNQTNKLLDLSGVAVSDVVAPAGLRFVFPCGTTLSPGQPLLIFSGSYPRGTFGNALVYTTNMTLDCSGTPRAICLQNSTGEGLNLTSATDGGIGSVRFSAAGGFIPAMDEPDQAYVRCASDGGTNCDYLGAGGVYLRHSTVSGADGGLFSPGTRVNGDEFTFGQSCSHAYQVTLADGGASAANTTAGFPNNLDNYVDSTGASCLGFNAAGGERIYAVVVPAGKTVSATVTPADTSVFGPDPALYLLTTAGCAANPPVCLTGADTGGSGESDNATWTNPADAGTQTVYLVVDTYDPAAAGPFSLSISVH